MSGIPRIFVTGVGLHTGYGDGDATWAAIAENRSALTCEHPWNQGWGESAAAAAFPAAPAPDPSPAEFLSDRKSIKYMGPCTQMAVLAAGRALRDAGLTNGTTAAERAAMALFVATGPISFDVEEALASVGREAAADLLGQGSNGLRRCHPLLPFKMLLNMPLGLVSIVFGIKGPNFILYPGAEQGACAISHAVRGMRQGRFRRALVGGSAHTLGLAPILGLRRAGRLAASRAEAQPFSAQHSGWGPADQAAFLVLETEAEALSRQAPVYASVDHVRVLGPGTADRLWSTFPAQPPDVVWGTGALSAVDVDADRKRGQGCWAKPSRLASADGLLGVAPAASFCLTAALACISLRRGSLPGSLVEDGRAVVANRVLVSFNDEHHAAAALLSEARR